MSDNRLVTSSGPVVLLSGAGLARWRGHTEDGRSDYEAIPAEVDLIWSPGTADCVVCDINDEPGPGVTWIVRPGVPGGVLVGGDPELLAESPEEGWRELGEFHAAAGGSYLLHAAWPGGDALAGKVEHLVLDLPPGEYRILGGSGTDGDGSLAYQALRLVPVTESGVAP